MKRIIPLLIFCWLSTLTQAQEITRMTLDEAIEYAVNNNSDIRKAQIDIANAEQRIFLSRASGLPQINGDVSFQRYLARPTSALPEEFVALARDPMTGELPPGFSREVSFVLKNSFAAGISLRTMLFDGSFFTGLAAAKEYRNLVQLQLKAKQKELKDKAIDAYLPALLLDESVKMMDKNITNLERIRFETSELYKEGFVEQLDVDRLDLSIANLKVEKDNLSRQRETVINVVKFAIGYPMDKPLELSSTMSELMTEVSSEDLTGAINYNIRHEYVTISKAIELNELNVRYNRSGYLPTANLIGSFQESWQGDSFSDGFWFPTAIVGVQLSIPIFDGYRKRSNIQMARLDTELTKIQQQDLERAITLEIQNARTAYLSAKDRLASQDKNMALAEKIYNTSQIKYKEGIGSSLELTQAEQSLFQTQQNYIQAQFEVLNAVMTLRKALGK